MRRRILSLWFIGLLGLAVHVDWHFGRPGHVHDLSGNSPVHFLFAIPVFVGAAFWIARWWPDRIVQASIVNITGGFVLAMVVEPIVSAPIFGYPISEAWSSIMWRIFLEFIAVGLPTFMVTLWLLGRKPVANRA
jgi:hypothetical protein